MELNENILIETIENDGKLINEYPVDESQIISNAGNAEVYETNFNNIKHTWEIITWNENAMNHTPGEKTLSLLN